MGRLWAFFRPTLEEKDWFFGVLGALPNWSKHQKMPIFELLIFGFPVPWPAFWPKSVPKQKKILSLVPTLLDNLPCQCLQVLPCCCRDLPRPGSFLETRVLFGVICGDRVRVPIRLPVGSQLFLEFKESLGPVTD